MIIGDIYRVHLFDVGMWVPECDKWIHDFEQPSTIVFCVALSDYDRASVNGKHEVYMLHTFRHYHSI